MKNILVVLVVLGRLAAPALAEPALDAKTQELENVCKQALNADPKFAEHVVATINDQTAQQHIDAAEHIAKNELHVIMAYAAMWLVAAGFLIFLWRRQRGLQSEIEALKNELEAAAKQANEELARAEKKKAAEADKKKAP